MTLPSSPDGGRVAAAALCRSVLVGRAAVTATAAGAGLLVGDRAAVLTVLAVVLAATAAELSALTRWPMLVAAPWGAAAVDGVTLLAVLVASRGSVAYFCYAVGSAAVAGVLLGMRALGLWVAQAALGFAVAAEVLRASPPSQDLTGFVVAFPMAGVVAGVGAAVATAALVRYVELSSQLTAQAQRTAAASERTRLARELHDSVAKTLRGVSFAALALPSSMRRHPALAEQLARTVSDGATAAAREARELLEGLRLDAPDRAYADTVRELCDTWSVTTGIAVRTDVSCAEPPVAVRYELSRILREALRNVSDHAAAGEAEVHVWQTRRTLHLLVRDDGVGFVVPDDLTSLHTAGHFGIVGMQERATTIGATVTITSTPDVGTVVTVAVPLPTVARAREHAR